MSDRIDPPRNPQPEDNTNITADSQGPEQPPAGIQNQQRIGENGTNWAEYDINAAPQVAVGTAPEAIPDNTPPEVVAPAGIDIEASIRPPSSSENKPIVKVPPKPWYKKWKIWLILAPLILLPAIIVPAVVATRASNSGSGATTSTPTASTSPIPECDPSDFRPGVNWIGSNPTGWSFDLGPANDAVDCCRQCYEDTESACNGWLYMPNDQNGVPPCNRIIDFQGPNAGDKCPNGKPDIVFTRGSGNSVEGNFGGGGPCTGRIRG